MNITFTIVSMVCNTFKYGHIHVFGTQYNLQYYANMCFTELKKYLYTYLRLMKSHNFSRGNESQYSSLSNVLLMMISLRHIKSRFRTERENENLPSADASINQLLFL